MRNLLPILILACPAAWANPDFEETVIEAGFRVQQPLLFASLTEDQRHVVLAGRDDDHRQRLAVYALDYPAEPFLSLNPGLHLIAYDVGRIGDSESLFFVEPGRVMRYDIATGKIVEFTKIRSIYGQERVGRIIPIDFVRDVNGDELDDLVLPDTAGYRLRLQRPDGSLGDEVVLQESSSMRVSDGMVSFESRPLVTGSMTGDGLDDLAVWRGDTLRIYAQLDDYRFDGEPDVYPLKLDLQTEAEIRAIEAGRGAGAMNQEGLRETRIWRIEDLNGDGLPDIMTESLLNKGVFDKENDFRLHLGRMDGDQITYDAGEDTLLAGYGLQYGLVTSDIDGDGRKDLLIRRVRLSFGRVIRALLSGNVSLQLYFYRMNEDGTYSEEANYVTKTNVKFSVSSGQVDIPAIKVADFDADGLQDLMMQRDSDELSFYPGIRSSQLFDDDATELELELPRNGDLVSIEDINLDGRADLVVRYNEADADGATKIVRLLLSRPAA